MHIDFKLPIHNQAYVGSITLKSNGQVDEQEGNPPRQGLRDITDERVESFVRNPSAAELGKPWKNYGTDEETGQISAVISGNFGKSEPSVASQFLHVDPKNHQVTIQTQDVNGPFFNHWIQAGYDGQSGKINPRTIVEWVSS